MKIKWVDIQTKSKILLDVKWSHLKGNDKPHLSVDIQQVRSQGENIQGWKEQKEAIAILNKDLGFLVSCHLATPDGFNLYMVSNGLYHFEQTKKHTMDQPHTRQDQDLLIDECYKKIEYYFNYCLKYTSLGIADQQEFFKRLNKDGTVKNFLEFLESKLKTFTSRKDFNNNFELLKKSIDEWKKQKARIVYSNLPNDSELWSVDRYSNYSGLTVDQVKELFFDIDYKSTLTNYFEEKAKTNKIKLDNLTELYNIPVVSN